jgi:heme-degrading monooxygenase HmoA
VSDFAETPEPPYYAVIFTSIREGDRDYAKTNNLMMELAARQPGFLGIEHAGGDGAPGITVSYWKDLASIAAWKAQADHRIAQQRGRAEWYSSFRLRIAKVERQTSFDR